MTANETAPTTRELALFLSRYSAWLMGAGATCIRLERNVTRIAHAYGKQVEVSIMLRHVHISVWEENSADSVTTIATVNHPVISFNINTELSRLSWAIADERITFAAARERFEAIVKGDKQNPWLVMLLVVLANASFCRLFGGDFVAMGIVALATLAGYYLKIVLLAHKVDTRVMFICCSFVSAILGATDALFAIGTTPLVALGTSVLYLVPGIPFLNSFSDLLYRHYLCAYSRFVDAMVLTCCLSIGLSAGMVVMHMGMF